MKENLELGNILIEYKKDEITRKRLIELTASLLLEQLLYSEDDIKDGH